MAWTDSRVFRAFVQNMAGNTAAFDLDTGADSIKNALFNNTITPDNDVTAANSAYNVGQWATAQEVFEAGQWAQTGVVIAGQVIDAGTADVVFFDATDTASGTAADLTNATGCLIYDDTLAAPVADQGICYNYFGGPNSVVNGTFTVVYHVNGIWRATL